ncbi:hypothetical protein JCM21900_004641 [Sporobolomyces salmonicolor]
MRFTLLAVALPLVPALLAASVPQAVNDAVDQLTFGSSLDDGDVCPDMKVRCIKDHDPTQVVGDIGKKTMVRSGLKCVQKHQKLNTAACNAKYPADCAAACEAYAAPV